MVGFSFFCAEAPKSGAHELYRKSKREKKEGDNTIGIRLFYTHARRDFSYSGGMFLTSSLS